ncbi:DUF4174 domain-containing protein [Cereibacter changlensis]|jgi:hypothetical protein|uniref:DUF4174 domain-containing protein n=1 Tax=Cereibacter changlensis TaxID=402884 RepID=A0A4V5NM63_9RHOB|nr:DUF4174 domain-containing protein [Cereibacter changlensis]MBZ4690364.1 hypothetical protein [Cereibacter sp.]TKA97527.1 DUF4174 domain-containing protein [Cereibacter changlensis]
MKPLYILALAAFLPLAAPAQEPITSGPVDAAGLSLDDFLWKKRPLVIFADTPADPSFDAQMRNLAENFGDLEQRDVIVITDTDPANPSEIRKALRPRGFSLVILDKDGRVTLRKPLPWSVREISRAIDKFPIRREEMLQRRPAGR